MERKEEEEEGEEEVMLLMAKCKLRLSGEITLQKQGKRE